MRRRARRALIAGLLSAGLVVGISTSSSAGSASPQATTVVFVAPVDRHARPLSSDSIVVAVRGTCEPGSDSVGGPVYRCFTDDNSVLDPCWAAHVPYDPSPHALLCMPAPWSTDVVLLDSKALQPSTYPVPSQLAYPWAVQLTNGLQCIAVQGAHDRYNSRVVDYSCGRPERLVLLRGIDQNHPLWTFDSARRIRLGTNFAAGPTMSVRTAWFAGWTQVRSKP